MALIIEDGSIVSGADSYATVAELRAYAAKRGVTLPAEDSDCEALLIKAMDYLQSYEDRFKGSRVQATQPVSWPRVDVCVYGFYIAADAIPQALIDAQVSLAIEAQSLDLQPTVDPTSQKGAVTEETVDVITVKYAEPAVARSTPSFAKADALLAPLLKSGGSQIRVIRS